MEYTHIIKYYSIVKNANGTSYNLDKPQKYAKWKKTDMKVLISWDPIYIECLENANLDTESRAVVG